MRQFALFANIGLVAAGTDRVATNVPQAPPDMLDMPIRGVGPADAGLQLAEAQQHRQGRAAAPASDDDLLRMRNFGKKSLDEMKERLRMRGFILPDTEDSSLGDDIEEVEDEEQFDDLPPEEA